MINPIISVQNFNNIVKKPLLVKKLRQLTLNTNSGMNYELNWMEKEAVNRKLKCKIILAHYSKKLIGWAIVSKENTSFQFSNTGKSFKSTDGVLFEIFIDKNYRQKGVGTAILKRAKYFARRKYLCVSPWDSKSESFYKKNALNKNIL